MPRTSNKADMIMDYVNHFIQENGYAPSVREIGAAVGLRSTASVSYHLQQLQQKGLLQAPNSKGKKRAIVTSVRPGQIPNVGVVTVPDSRLDVLAKMYNPEKYTPAIIEFVDIAGLVKGASKGEGLGNKFLDNIRQVDAIVHVVRCFEDDNIIHVDGNINPIRDLETINLELIFSDMEILERRIDRVKKAMKGDKTLAATVELLERIHATLEEGKCARIRF